MPGVKYVRDEKGKLQKEVELIKGKKWQSVMESEYSRVRVTQTVEVRVG